MIEEARNMALCAERSYLLSEAVCLLMPGVQKINLPVICQLLYEGIFYFI